MSIIEQRSILKDSAISLNSIQQNRDRSKLRHHGLRLRESTVLLDSTVWLGAALCSVKRIVRHQTLFFSTFLLCNSSKCNKQRPYHFTQAGYEGLNSSLTHRVDISRHSCFSGLESRVLTVDGEIREIRSAKRRWRRWWPQIVHQRSCVCVPSQQDSQKIHPIWFRVDRGTV